MRNVECKILKERSILIHSFTPLLEYNRSEQTLNCVVMIICPANDVSVAAAVNISLYLKRQGERFRFPFYFMFLFYFPTNGPSLEMSILTLPFQVAL